MKELTIKHICIITPGYPNEKSPHSFTFVEKLVSSFAEKNIKCTVINPVALRPQNIKKTPPDYWEQETLSGKKISVYCPKYMYFYAKKIKKMNTGIISRFTFEKAVMRVIEKENITPDIIYGHFIHPAGVTAARIGEKLNIPTYFAYGESSPWGIDIYNKKWLKDNLKNVKGVVAVSTAKKKEIMNYQIIAEEKIKIFPNGIDDRIFYQRDKLKMREAYNLSKEDFIVGYTGRFNESKGVLRLLEAVNNQAENIKLVLIGGGKLKFDSENIIFKDLLPHEEVPRLLSACDIFVLPTLNEGCSNAIIEAMACGLPIVTSDKEFNYDILNYEKAVLVNPYDTKEIGSAITKLKKDKELRKNLSEESITTAKQLNIEDRAKKILDWMDYNYS